MSKSDFNPEDLEFRRQLDPALSSLRSNAGRCPDPDMLIAVESGMPVGNAETVRSHLAACPICQQLCRDLKGYEFQLSEEEDRRIRNTLPRRSSWTSFWKPIPIAITAALAVALLAGLWTFRSSTTPNAIPATSQTAQSSPNPGPVLKLEKAAVKVPAAAVLLYRNGGNTDKAYLQDLAAALEPYRAENFAESALRLQELSTKYPKSAEAFFYLGVSQLFLNQPEKALDSLKAAKPLADESLQDDVSWYLAVALERSGQPQDARSEVDRLCTGARDYKEKACRALVEMKSK
jgi:hypothetical protein